MKVIDASGAQSTRPEARGAHRSGYDIDRLLEEPECKGHENNYAAVQRAIQALT